MPEILAAIVDVLNLYLIRGMFISGLVILAYRVATEKRPVADYALSILRKVVAAYCVLALLSFVTQLSGNYMNRITGPYWWSYVILLTTHLGFPFLLLTKKPGRNIYFFLLIAFFMNIGWVFELYTIRISSFHSGYGNEENSWLIFFPSDTEIAAIFKGIFLGITVLIIARFLSRKNLKKESSLSL